MSYHFAIHPSQKIACFRFSDRVNISEARQAFVDYVAHPDFQPDYAMLSDARAVTGIEASFVGILTNVQGLSAQLRNFEKGAVSVVLVAGATTFGMVRMLEQVLDFTSKIKMRIATTEGEALAEVGLPDADFAALFQF